MRAYPRFAGLFAIAAILCTAGIGLAADEAPSDAVVKVQTDYPDCKEGYCVPGRDFGSGVIVSGESGRYAIVTNHHVIRGALATREKARYTVHFRGRTYPARPIVDTPRDDLAILEVLTSDSLPVAELGDEPEPGDNVVTMGYPEAGQLVQQSTRIDRRVEDGNFVMPGESRSGHSGGGVFRGRQLVGIHWGSDLRRRESHAVTISKLKYSMKYCGLRWTEKRKSVQIANSPRFTAPLPPAPAPVAPPPPLVNASDSDTTRKLQALTDRLTSIEALIKNIPAGPSGPAGVAGPPGAAGVNGPAGPMGPAGATGLTGTVTVILIGPDGKEIKRAEQVQTGSVVQLDITKVLLGDNDGRGK